MPDLESQPPIRIGRMVARCCFEWRTRHTQPEWASNIGQPSRWRKTLGKPTPKRASRSIGEVADGHASISIHLASAAFMFVYPGAADTARILKGRRRSARYSRHVTEVRAAATINNKSASIYTGYTGKMLRRGRACPRSERGTACSCRVVLDRNDASALPSLPPHVQRRSDPAACSAAGVSTCPATAGNAAMG